MGECSSSLVQTLLLGFKAFVFEFDDIENALPLQFGGAPSIFDITFLRLKLKSLDLWIKIDIAAYQIKTGEVQLSFNDWANEIFSERLLVEIPSLSLACINAESAALHDGDLLSASSTEVQARIETRIKLSLYNRKSNFEESRSKQQNHVKDHDKPTGRGKFLLNDSIFPRSSLDADGDGDETTFQAPPMPPPIYGRFTLPI